MSYLKSLSDKDKNTFLLLTSSNLAEIYVYDSLKKRCNATLESVYDINTLNSYKNMLELINVQPNLADEWLFVISYDKVKNNIKKSLGIFQAKTSAFLIKVKNYKEFKEVKELGIPLTGLYLDTIRRNDVADLLNEFTLSKKVVDFIAYSYYKEPEKVFTIYNELKNGAVIDTTKDVVKLCGESQGSIQTFVIQLLEDSPKSMMFLKRNFKKRVNSVYTLCDTFGSKTAFNFIKSIVKDILYIKMLYLEGVVYDKIRDIPECFDEKKLSRYNSCLNIITNDISYDKILYLYNKLNETGNWYKIQDGVLFLYNYYLDLINKNSIT